MRLLFLLPILLLLASSASSQPTATSRVCLTAAKAQQIKDSLDTLPTVRLEASAWRVAYDSTRTAADSLRRANLLHREAGEATQRAFVGQVALTASAKGEAGRWRALARRRGLLNWLALVGASLAIGFTVSH